ncbi:hypothetical protein C1I97_27210 [Streptomyces sp. NTH33]|uniref:hypothetical protein n=1 Tax=Streptomyces sp. NTH33 TaxID=1735453 RepID=UPI000DB120AC|nr:hypothetical protein [Streptomyces sp. NTH33]PZG95251.1 hypothetical protein C1I97_27210 [Streptomyces sp. NTH33]
MSPTVNASFDPAPVPSAEDLVRLWPLSWRRPARERVVSLLVALDGPAALDYPLGSRNQRLLALHQALVRRPVEARVTCPSCRTDNEFALPVRAVAELPRAEADAVVRLSVEGVELTFRLPVLADLIPVAGRPPADGLHALARDTCLAPRIPRLGPDALDRLADAWEALDPAGSMRVDLLCAGCGREIAADADPADFVARDLDLLVDELMREVDVIAGGYGWTEEAILAMPSPRRRRYVELIVEGRAPARRAAAVR